MVDRLTGSSCLHAAVLSSCAFLRLLTKHNRLYTAAQPGQCATVHAEPRPGMMWTLLHTVAGSSPLTFVASCSVPTPHSSLFGPPTPPRPLESQMIL